MTEIRDRFARLQLFKITLSAVFKMFQARSQRFLFFMPPTPKPGTGCLSAIRSNTSHAVSGTHRRFARIRRRLARLIFVTGALCATVVVAPVSYADYEQGAQAWDAKRYQEAIVQWMTAANNEDGRAMLAIGRAYLQGLGVLQDYVEAYKWFNLAASFGISDAVAERDAISVEMTAEERSEARKLARNWKPDKSTEQSSDPVMVEETSTADAKEETSVTGSNLSRDAIREAQTLLARMGYRPGPADGIWGPKTASALQSFLNDSGLPPTEALTLATLDEMRKRAGPSPSASTSAASSIGTILFYFASIGFDTGLNHALNAGIDINQTDERGWTALMHAAKNGNFSTAQLLINAGANAAVQASDGTTALSLARDSQHSDLIGLLSGSISTASEKQQQSSTVPNKVAKPSLNRPIDSNTLLFGVLTGQNWETQSALDGVSKEFEAEMGRKPSVQGVDENGLNDLHWAAALNLPDLAEVLIKEGIGVNRRDRTYGATALHYANNKDSAQTARVLIAYGADFELKDRSGQTPLHYAAQVDAHRTAQILISNGADPDARDKTDRTPLHDAAEENAVNVAEILIANGANLEAKDRNYNTPLNYANPRSEVAFLLISNGASIF